MEPLTAERVELMISRAIERYDEKQDKRFSDTNARLDRNVHETRNFRETVNAQFYTLKEDMVKQINSGHALLGNQLDTMKTATGKQLETIMVAIGSTTGINKYKEYLWPTLFTAAIAVLTYLTYARGH